MKIMMVCLGNICRSPLAEGVLQKKADEAGLNWQVDSSGTNGYHTGEAPHKLSQKVALLHGVDISEQRAWRFKASFFDEYDKIYVMANDVLADVRRIAGSKFNAKKIDFLLNELTPGTNQDLTDPWYGEEPGYHDVYALVDKACDAILAKHALNLVIW